MKRNILFLSMLIIFFSACKKKEDVPSDTTDERLNAVLTAYQKQLAGSEFGWKGYLLTDSKVAVNFLFSFTNTNRTTMSADFEPTAAESSYRLKALQRPTLIFDTYSTLHKLSDPNPNKLGGTYSAGYYSDFEFAFVSASADTITLEGTFNKSKLVLIRSKSVADNAAVFTSADAMATTLSKLRTYFKRTKIGGIDSEVTIDAYNRKISFKYLSGTTPTSVSSSYFVDGTTLILFDPLKVGTATVKSLAGVSFDAGSGFISASVNNAPIQITEAITPLSYDPTIAAIFLANPIHGTYSENYDGFTVDGISDAYGVTTIPNFLSIDYYHKITGTNYGAVRFYLATGYGAYGPAIIPALSSDGKIIYTLAGSYGTAPTAIRPIITNVTNNFLTPQGFYVIQTDTKVFDLVAVSDARSWITFQ